MKLEQIPSVQNWLPYERILEKGIIKMKDASYIKILKVLPINYNLKSDLEKDAILNSYINLFKSTNLNLQILIQSTREDLNNNILNLKKNNEHEELQKKYIEYIQYLNKIKKSSSKNFYLIIKESTSEKEENAKIENLQNEYGLNELPKQKKDSVLKILLRAVITASSDSFPSNKFTRKSASRRIW